MQDEKSSPRRNSLVTSWFGRVFGTRVSQRKRKSTVQSIWHIFQDKQRWTKNSFLFMFIKIIAQTKCKCKHDMRFLLLPGQLPGLSFPGTLVIRFFLLMASPYITYFMYLLIKILTRY